MNIKKKDLCVKKRIPRITETNQARFAKLSGCGLQEGSDAPYFMEIKGLAKEKKIELWPSV